MPLVVKPIKKEAGKAELCQFSETEGCTLDDVFFKLSNIYFLCVCLCLSF